MSGVDLNDNRVANYKSRIIGKTWWLSLSLNGLVSTLVNCWKLFNLAQCFPGLTGRKCDC